MSDEPAVRRTCPETKTYLKAAYPWIPTKVYNLLAAFVGRGLELAEPESEPVRAITSRSRLLPEDVREVADARCFFGIGS